MFTYIAKVDRVVDGDTIDVSIDLGFDIWHKTRLRLAHIDVYEHNTEIGKKATEYVKNIIEGKMVEITTSKPDKYGRYLATVIIDGGNLNASLVSKGFAVPYEGGTKTLKS